ncbi:hypothetical protein [Rhizobium sp. L43]|uniref:hypothetical protein n=1 Tax=Rhizobium sp. L43 TaxID=2035452 RepID=UPI000BEA8F67|nr:hypothetical protein [Rhizobium sp. L43]PDS75469.1 hypothetical protein CO667_26670 [Rhizobium sp. L43]
MNHAQEAHFTRSHSIYLRRYRDDFQISMPDWLAYWRKSPLRNDRFEMGAAAVVVDRIDATKPWTINNLSVTRRVIKGVKRKGRNSEVVTPYEDSRTLSLKQWLAEVRN